MLDQLHRLIVSCLHRWVGSQIRVGTRARPRTPQQHTSARALCMRRRNLTLSSAVGVMNSFWAAQLEGLRPSFLAAVAVSASAAPPFLALPLPPRQRLMPFACGAAGRDRRIFVRRRSETTLSPPPSLCVCVCPLPFGTAVKQTSLQNTPV